MEKCLSTVFAALPPGIARTSFSHLVAILIVAGPGSGQALEFFSVNQDIQRLVRIDATSGCVTAVAPSPLGTATFVNHLQMVGSRLMGVTGTSAPHARLVEIDILTGQVLPIEYLICCPEPTVIESVAAVDGQLKTGFNALGLALSRFLADVALDGTMSSVAEYSSAGGLPAIDLDALAHDPANSRLIAIDGISAIPQVNLYTIVHPVPPPPPPPPDRSLLFSLDRPGFRHAVVVGSTLYGIENDNETLLKISLENESVMDSISIEPSGVYLGLAIVPSVQAIIEFFDAASDSGSLEGSGPNPRAAAGRLNALRNMLLTAQTLLDLGFFQEACDQLLDAQLRTDGLRHPPDFAGGEAADELYAMIVDLRSSLGCPTS